MVGTLAELPFRILGTAACTKKREDQLRRTTRDFLTRIAKWIKVSGGIFENVSWSVKNLLRLFKKFFFHIKIDQIVKWSSQ